MDGVARRAYRAVWCVYSTADATALHTERERHGQSGRFGYIQRKCAIVQVVLQSTAVCCMSPTMATFSHPKPLYAQFIRDDAKTGRAPTRPLTTKVLVRLPFSCATEVGVCSLVLVTCTGSTITVSGVTAEEKRAREDHLITVPTIELKSCLRDFGVFRDSGKIGPRWGHWLRLFSGS